MSERTGNLAAGRMAVLIPTTGEIVCIAGVKSRPRLASSYAAITGDYRPLRLSGDYHRFVSGPLTLIRPAQRGSQDTQGDLQGAHGPFELSLSGDIDTGQSWELPTLIAHLLTDVDRLAPCPPPAGQADALKIRAATDGIGGNAATIVWATGMVDTDLAPQPDDYAIAQKCRLSRPLLEGWKAAGHDFRFIVPRGLADADRAELAQLADAFSAPLIEAGNLGEVAGAVGVRLPAEDVTPVGTKGDGGELHEPRQPPGPRQPPESSQRLGYYIGLATAALVALYFMASGVDDIVGALGGRSETAAPGDVVAVHQLKADNRQACIRHIMFAKPLREVTLPAAGDGYTIDPSNGLCGLRLRNVSSGSLELTLSSELQPFAIRGVNALFRGVSIASGEKIDLLFSQPPRSIASTLSIRDADAGQWQTRIRIADAGNDEQ